jgi:hypothetical protein
LSSPNMDNALPPANEAKSIQQNVHAIQRTGVAVQTVGTVRQPFQQRPKSTHCDFRESRRWAESNAEWIDNGRRPVQPTLDRRRVSEDLLRSRPVQAAWQASETEQRPHHRRNPSDAEPVEQAPNPRCLSRSLSTGHWLNLRWDTTQRKIHVHHQLSRFVRKITDTSIWASKEPPASLDRPQEQSDGDRLAQATLNSKTRKPSNRRVTKLSKKPGMDNIGEQKEAAVKAQEKPDEPTNGGIINLNAADDGLTQSDKIPARRDEDIEETKRKSADLREAPTEHQSDRHGNLLPEINTDTMGDLGTIAQQREEQRAISESAVEIHYSSEELLGIDSIEDTAWKTSNPSSGTSVLNNSLSPPRPGPRNSSRHSGISSSTLRGVYGSPLAGHSAASATIRAPRNGSPESFVTVVQPPGIAASRCQTLAVQPRESRSADAFSVFGAPVIKSTDTLTVITNEALGDCRRPLVPFILTATESVAATPPPRPTKLHSGLVSSGRAPSDAPNRPLPDLPEAPTPAASETSRRDAGSRASSRSRRSLQRMLTQPGHNRRTSSLASIASLDGVLQGTTSPYGSPQRQSKSAKKTGSIRSSSQKRSSVLPSLTDAQCREPITIENISEARSPALRHAHDISAFASTRDARESASRDQRIHDKRLQDIASARAKRRRKATREGHQSSQEEPAAEDFPPPPPSSRPPRRTTVNRQKPELKSHTQTANTSAIYWPSSSNLQRTQAIPTSPPSDIPSPACHVQTSQMSTASSYSRAASSVPIPVPLAVSIPRVTETKKSRQGPSPKQSHDHLRSNLTASNSQMIQGTPTPALSESSTPSSDEDGTGVVGVTNAHKAQIQKHRPLGASDVAAMIADMHSMREQLNGQMRKIQAQSKQIRAIEMQKVRMVEAVNALVAVVSEPVSMVPVSSQRPIRSAGAYPHLGWPGKDSVARTSNTGASGDSASSRSGSSDVTFITEPETFSHGLMSQEGMEFNMDFDRMQELIRLDRRKVGFGACQEGKGKRSTKKSGGSAVGYLRIGA